MFREEVHQRGISQVDELVCYIRAEPMNSKFGMMVAKHCSDCAQNDERISGKSMGSSYAKAQITLVSSTAYT